METCRFEHLISSMHEKNFSMMENSLIDADALLINQCDEEAEESIVHENVRWRMIRTRERGLSRSRNLAIKNARGEVCLICDNDERFVEGYVQKISDAYTKCPQADIIIFDIGNHPKRIKKIPHQMKYFELLRVSSWQISFRTSSLQEKEVSFDERMGAGTGNGAEEEVKFLMDCYRAGLRIWYVPTVIADLVENESTWFHGFDEKFFENRGMTTRYILGLPLSCLYGIYYVVMKRSMYQKDLSMTRAVKALFRGIFQNRLSRMK